MIPYRLIPLISALKEFRFFVTVGPSAHFGPALNLSKIDNIRWYLINLISRVPKVSKAVQKTLATPKVKLFQNNPCLVSEYTNYFPSV